MQDHEDKEQYTKSFNPLRRCSKGKAYVNTSLVGKVKIDMDDLARPHNNMKPPHRRQKNLELEFRIK